MSESTQATPQAEPEQERHGLGRYAVLVAVGAFATTFAQQRIVANIPTTALLKDHFMLAREDVALFFFWATFAWNIKPIAGVLTDAFPLFGTRRRHYMIVGATLSAVCWVVMGTASDNYKLLILSAMAMNAFTVMSSTVMGGMMVEAGQIYGAPGRISSLRQVVQSVAMIIGPIIGGILASYAFGYTTGIAAGVMLLLALTTFFVHKEKKVSASAPLTDEERSRPHYKPPGKLVAGVVALVALATGLTINADVRNIGISLFAFISVLVLILGLALIRSMNPVIVRAQGQLVKIFDSRSLWLAVFMLFLVYTVPGLWTALYFQQTDTLKFSTEYIGTMGSIEGGVGVVSALVYGIACRKFSLRWLLFGGVGLSALATFTYLVYSGTTAPFVHGAGGFCGVLAELALMDLAVRSTPKGCEGLGFALMMAIRNFGIAMSDVIGTLIMDKFGVTFNTMVIVNASFTIAVLFFVVFLPKAIIDRKEGEAAPA